MTNEDMETLNLQQDEDRLYSPPWEPEIAFRKGWSATGFELASFAAEH